jgi:hypothetical protein
MRRRGGGGWVRAAPSQLLCASSAALVRRLLACAACPPPFHLRHPFRGADPATAPRMALQAALCASLQQGAADAFA